MVPTTLPSGSVTGTIISPRVSLRVAR
jgi:hypothetical protein